MKLVTRLNVVALLCILALIMSTVAITTPGPQGPQGEPGPSGVQGVAGVPGMAGTAGTTGARGPIGPTGPKGLDGTDGADGTGFVWRGTWSSSKAYTVGDVVSRSGSSYICILDSVKQCPPSSDYWNLMALKGDRGTSWVSSIAVLDRQVSESAGDAWRRLDLSAWSQTSDIQNVGSNGPSASQLGGGFHFEGIFIPSGAPILNAYLTVTALNTLSGPDVKSRISAEAVGSPSSFTGDAATFDTRWGNRTIARVDWDNIPKWYVNVAYDSPDIKAVIQEIVNRADWVFGGSIVIFWDDFDGRTVEEPGRYRTVYSYDNNPYYAVRLHIEYASY